VEAGSFSAAGEHLGVAKSVVSRRISQLEKHLGSQLLHRTTRQLALTDIKRLGQDDPCTATDSYSRQQRQRIGGSRQFRFGNYQKPHLYSRQLRKRWQPDCYSE